MVVYTKGEINRAGSLLRNWWTAYDPDDEQPTSPGVVEAVGLVSEFRRTISPPLAKTTVGLRQFVGIESSRTRVAQRLKALPRIVNKLAREPGMQLARMGDVGGCRAILSDQHEVYRVLARIRKNWTVKVLNDYVETPRDTGYRAVHVVIERDGRLIELQLRTLGQHLWADQVEAEETSGGHSGLKGGQGRAEVVDYFRVLSDAVHARDNHPDQLDDALMHLSVVRPLAAPFLRTQ